MNLKIVFIVRYCLIAYDMIIYKYTMFIYQYSEIQIDPTIRILATIYFLNNQPHSIIWVGVLSITYESLDFQLTWNVILNCESKLGGFVLRLFI